MAFEITGHKAGLEGAFVRTQAHTAADALRFAREWAGQGVTGITIVNPKGESYDIDGFGLIVSTKEDDSDSDRPKGGRRPADVIGNTIKVARIATGEERKSSSPSPGRTRN
jgi:hypothetical protein